MKKVRIRKYNPDMPEFISYKLVRATLRKKNGGLFNVIEIFKTPEGNFVVNERGHTLQYPNEFAGIQLIKEGQIHE